MSTLFEIDQAIRDFTEKLVPDEDGVIEEVNFSELEDLNMARAAKLEGIALVIKEKKARIEALKKQKDLVASWIEKDQKTIDWLSSYLSNSMLGNGQELLETERCRVSFRWSRDVVTIDNEDKIPKKYMKKKVTISPDKTAIKEAMKNGQKVAGCHLEDHQNIQIK